jgi:hypothetical protein
MDSFSLLERPYAIAAMPTNTKANGIVTVREEIPFNEMYHPSPKDKKKIALNKIHVLFTSLTFNRVS